MPTYIYECNECEHSFEQLQKMSDEPLKKCPECGKNELFKVITGGIYACVKNTNTVGQLADKNAKKYKSMINENQAKKKEEAPKPDKPFYHGEATRKEINKMTNKQRQRYIMEGKK